MGADQQQFLAVDTLSLLSGGNAGLGRETVRVLAAAGADVVFTSRSAEAGQRVAQELATSGVKVCSPSLMHSSCAIRVPIAHLIACSRHAAAKPVQGTK